MSMVNINEDKDSYSLDVTDYSDIVNLIKRATEEYENQIVKQEQLLSDLQIDTDTFDSSLKKNVTEIACQALAAHSLNDTDIAVHYNNEILRELKSDKKKWEIKQMIHKQLQKNEKVYKKVQDFEKELEKAKVENSSWCKTDVEYNQLEKKINELSKAVEKQLENKVSELNAFEFKEDIAKLIELRTKKESLLKELSKYKGFSSDIIEATNQVEELKIELSSL